MQELLARDLDKMSKTQNYETIINNGEVIGVEKMHVNVEHRSFFYFVFTDRHKYASK